MKLERETNCKRLLILEKTQRVAGGVVGGDGVMGGWA